MKIWYFHNIINVLQISVRINFMTSMNSLIQLCSIMYLWRRIWWDWQWVCFKTNHVNNHSTTNNKFWTNCLWKWTSNEFPWKLYSMLWSVYISIDFWRMSMFCWCVFIFWRVVFKQSRIFFLIYRIRRGNNYFDYFILNYYAQRSEKRL